MRSLRRALDTLAPDETGAAAAALDTNIALDSALQGASVAMAANWRATPQAVVPSLPAPGEAVCQDVTEALDSPSVAAAVPATAASGGSLDSFAAKVRLLREWSWVRPTPPSSAEPVDRAPPGANV